MKKSAIFLSLVFLVGQLFGQLDSHQSISQGGQNYEQYYDVAVQEPGASSSLLYVGNGVVAETSDIIVTKRTNAGGTEWIKNYDSSGSEFGHRIIFTGDGGFAVTGWTTVNGSDDLLVMKCSEDGTVEWTKAIGGSGIERGRGISETPDGDLIIAGHTNTETLGVNDILVVKLDADGNVLWKNRYGGSGNENGWDVETLSDGSHMVTGNVGSVGLGFTNLALMKLAADGTLIWLRGFGSEDGATAGVASDVDFEDNVSVAGWTEADGAGGRDAYLAFFDSDGSLIDDFVFGGEGFDTATDVDQYSAFGNNFIVVGKSENLGSAVGEAQPFVGWFADGKGISTVQILSAGTDIPEGELLGVEVILPLDSPEIVAAGLSVNDDNTDTYRVELSMFGNNCSEAVSLTTESGFFGFEEGGSSEPDETVETSPEMTSTTISWDETIDCLDILSSTNENEKTGAILVFPNPTKDQFSIKGCGQTRYWAIDAQGKTTDEGIYNGTPISTEKWPPGIYLVKTEDCGKGKITVTR